jgi:chorismate mutase/prephenate dehydratase
MITYADTPHCAKDVLLMSLDELRARIDGLDARILDLLLERADIATQVGERKRDTDNSVYVPEREAQLLRDLLDRDLGPLDADAVSAVFREIVSVCRAAERELRISYLGPEHTFTHLAAVTHFGSACEFVPASSIPDIFRAVEARQADFGVVPIQNSTEGAVGPTLDSFLDTSLRICDELYVPIHHYLMSRGELGEISRVHSHPQVLAQCRGWLREHLPAAELVPTASSGVAAANAAGDPTIAAIAPEPAARAHGLAVLADHIEDLPNNRTRFFVIGDLDPRATGQDKTSVVFSTPHRAGALHYALGLLAEHAINLTMIQSRPARGQLWEYDFYVDFTGHATDAPQAAALANLRDYCALLKVLGSYPDASPLT